MLMGMILPVEAIRRQIASAIDLFVYIQRDGEGGRKVTEITQITGMREGEILMEPLFAMKNGVLERTANPVFRRKGAIEVYADIEGKQKNEE